MRGAITRFPQVYAGVDQALLLKTYEAGPARLRQAIAGLTRAELRHRLAPDVWTIQEVVVHLADSELTGAGRIRLTLAQPGSTFYGYNQDIWARAFRYQDMDAGEVETAIGLFAALRATTARLLRRANGADWSAAGIHPEHGTVTLRNLLELYADHSERHIAQIVQRRGRLERPLDLPPLLKERLY